MAGRFALFQGGFYYPAGGWDDFAGVFPDADSAEAAYWWGHPASECSPSAYEKWGHIVDLEARQIVRELKTWEAIPFAQRVSPVELAEFHKRRAGREAASAATAQDFARNNPLPRRRSSRVGTDRLAKAFDGHMGRPE